MSNQIKCIALISVLFLALVITFCIPTKMETMTIKTKEVTSNFVFRGTIVLNDSITMYVGNDVVCDIWLGDNDELLIERHFNIFGFSIGAKTIKEIKYKYVPSKSAKVLRLEKELQKLCAEFN